MGTTPVRRKLIRTEDDPGSPSADDELLARTEALFEEGREYWDRFDAEVRQDNWHPFVAANYTSVRDALWPLRNQGSRFLEWGSATGVITVMADMLGFDSCGIELDATLVNFARESAERWNSGARFAQGSFIPMGWKWKPRDGDARPGTIGDGPSGYLELGYALSDFDIVYGYPWKGEEGLMHDLMRSHGDPDARLLLHSSEDGLTTYHGGRVG